jgi:hypothetical protein
MATSYPLPYLETTLRSRSHWRLWAYHAASLVFPLLYIRGLSWTEDRVAQLPGRCNAPTLERLSIGLGGDALSTTLDSASRHWVKTKSASIRDKL